MTKRKKMNRKKREERRQFHADTFNEGFVMAWELREQEVRNLQKQIEQMDRNRRKIHGSLGGR